MDNKCSQLYLELLRDMEKLINNMRQLPLNLLQEVLNNLENQIVLLKKDLCSNDSVTFKNQVSIEEVDNFEDVSVDGELGNNEIKIVVEEDGKIMNIGLFDHYSPVGVDKPELSGISEQMEMEEKIIIQKLEDFFECLHCSSNFATKTSLEQHILSSHPQPESAIFSCSLCEKKFLSEVGLYLHVQNKHSDGKGPLLKCDEEDCSYSTSSKQLLRVHKFSHDTNSVMKCPICSKEYLGGPVAFKNHMKLHTGDKKAVCDICDKSFVSQSRLTYHKANVHDPPKYQCDNCSKMFRSKVSFERHILVHSNDPNTSRPFQCEFCDYKARTSGNLTSHVKSIHLITDFTAGKKEKEQKKEKVSRKILSLSKFKNIGDSEQLKTALGKAAAEDYISSISAEQELTLNKLQQSQAEKQLGPEVSGPTEMIDGQVGEVGQSQILTLRSEKGELGLINVIRVERADLETVESDGVVFDETKLVEEYEMSEALGQEVHIEPDSIYSADNIVYII